jgi:hypothetical protein
MKSENKQPIRTFLFNHLNLLALVLLVAGVLYMLFSNLTTAVAGGVVLLLAHLAAVTGLLLLGRSRLAKLGRGWFIKLQRWVHEN